MPGRKQLFEAFLVFAAQLVLIVGVVGSGLSMSPEVIQDLARKRQTVLTLTILQSLLLPLTGIATVAVLRPALEVQTAILIISACPGGGISNLYVLFARSNAALSVAMTLTSICLVSVTMPVILYAFNWLGYESITNKVSLILLSFKLFTIMAVSVGLGLGLRAFWPAKALQWETYLRRVSAFLILVVVLAVLWEEWVFIKTTFFQMIVSASLLFSLALISGILVGYLILSSLKDRYAVMAEFGARNLSIGIFVAIGLFGNSEFAGSAAVYLFVEAAVLLLLGNFVRKQH